MNYRIELKVKDLLEQNHITQKRLAEIANMRESTISDIVRGTRTVINFEHLSRIAEALDIQDISQLTLSPRRVRRATHGRRISFPA
ncbi:MAG: helix-turn-helix transcriptional regulator [Oscillospiraceae bacterium]